MTGTFPYRTGIIDNEWYDREKRGQQYCVEDAQSPIVGVPRDRAELKGVSPRNLLVSTVGDSLRDATAGRGKVFGLTIKDRAAVLMAGKKPTGAFWFDSKSGMWVTSTHYRQDLPEWLKQINHSDLVECYAGSSWRLLYDPEQYHKTAPDDSPFEGTADGNLDRSFPHALSHESDSRYMKQLFVSPFGNELTMRVVRQLIEGEDLGGDDVPDILTIGLSCNDFVGHNFGPHSLEVEDMTYRTDLLISEFIGYLDQRIGSGKWTLLLTADHGVTPIPEYNELQGLPAKRNPMGQVSQLAAQIETQLTRKFGPPRAAMRYLEALNSNQLFLERRSLPDEPSKKQEIREFVRDSLLKTGVFPVAYTRDELEAGATSIRLPETYAGFVATGSDIFQMMQRTYHRDRSGDVLFVLKPYQIQTSTPATHGSPWKPDTHVPLLAIGYGIRSGRFDRPTSPAAIASTVAKLLRIDPPTTNEEQPLREALGE
jgi:predicted AlkP superfamily pyrophosphatase or phosphodiesterase